MGRIITKKIEMVRMEFDVSKDVYRWFANAAAEKGLTHEELFRQALSVMKAYKESGCQHIGFTNDASKLDTEILGIL